MFEYFLKELKTFLDFCPSVQSSNYLPPEAIFWEGSVLHGQISDIVISEKFGNKLAPFVRHSFIPSTFYKIQTVHNFSIFAKKKPFFGYHVNQFFPTIYLSIYNPYIFEKIMVFILQLPFHGIFCENCNYNIEIHKILLKLENTPTV